MIVKAGWCLICRSSRFEDHSHTSDEIARLGLTTRALNELDDLRTQNAALVSNRDYMQVLVREHGAESIGNLIVQRDALAKALREICFTSPSVESGMSFREWAKGIASNVLMGGGGGFETTETEPHGECAAVMVVDSNSKLPSEAGSADRPLTANGGDE